MADQQDSNPGGFDGHSGLQNGPRENLSSGGRSSEEQSPLRPGPTFGSQSRSSNSPFGASDGFAPFGLFAGAGAPSFGDGMLSMGLASLGLATAASHGTTEEAQQEGREYGTEKASSFIDGAKAADTEGRNSWAKWTDEDIEGFKATFETKANAKFPIPVQDDGTVCETCLSRRNTRVSEAVDSYAQMLRQEARSTPGRVVTLERVHERASSVPSQSPGAAYQFT